MIPHLGPENELYMTLSFFPDTHTQLHILSPCSHQYILASSECLWGRLTWPWGQHCYPRHSTTSTCCSDYTGTSATCPLEPFWRQTKPWATSVGALLPFWRLWNALISISGKKYQKNWKYCYGCCGSLSRFLEHTGSSHKRPYGAGYVSGETMCCGLLVRCSPVAQSTISSKSPLWDLLVILNLSDIQCQADLGSIPTAAHQHLQRD